MLDPGDQRFLRGTRIGGNKDGVVATNIADDLGPVAAVKSECNALCCADCSAYNEEIGTGRLLAAQQVSDGSHRFVATPLILWQFITIAGLDRADLVKIAADAGLRCCVTVGRQRCHEGRLRCRRSLEQ